MRIMRIKEAEEFVPYIVTIKDQYLDKLVSTTIRKTFCGYLVNDAGDNFYFELNGNRMMVIIKHNWIEFMAPSKVHFEMWRNKTCS